MDQIKPVIGKYWNNRCISNSADNNSLSPLYLFPQKGNTNSSFIIEIYYVHGHFVVRTQIEVARNRKKTNSVHVINCDTEAKGDED